MLHGDKDRLLQQLLSHFQDAEIKQKQGATIK